MTAPAPVNILVVDDDGVDVRHLVRSFHRQALGYPVFVASDGIEALDLLRGTSGRERVARPYLVLLDLNMPRMDGIQFLKEVRGDSGLSNTIVFVLTTSNSDDDKLAAYQQHAAGYLLKSEGAEGYVQVAELIQQYAQTIQFPPEPRSPAHASN